MSVRTPSLIAVVDDDRSQRRLLRRWLERAELAVREFPDGSSCVRAVERLRPDVVLLDVNLGEERGLDVLAQLRSAYPYLPVIMFTVETDVDTVVSAMRAGAWGYLAKPTSRRKLLGAVRSALATRPAHQDEEDTSDEATFSGLIGDTLPMSSTSASAQTSTTGSPSTRWRSPPSETDAATSRSSPSSSYNRPPPGTTNPACASDPRPSTA